MKEQNIAAAVREAARFFRRAEALAKRLNDEPDLLGHMEAGFGCKESGALRRASLDLTRALAEMRRSAY